MVRLYRLRKLVEHVQSISQVVEGRCILGVKLNGLRVRRNGSFIVSFNAQGITQVVERLRFFRVDLDRPLVMINSIIHLLDQVKRITQIVVHVRQLVIYFERLPVVVDGLLRRASVVVAVAKANQGLKLSVVQL